MALAPNPPMVFFLLRANMLLACRYPIADGFNTSLVLRRLHNTHRTEGRFLCYYGSVFNANLLLPYRCKRSLIWRRLLHLSKTGCGDLDRPQGIFNTNLLINSVLLRYFLPSLL
jgi:hypothetical protein